MSKWDVSSLSEVAVQAAVKKANAWPGNTLLNPSKMLNTVDQAAYLLFQMELCWRTDYPQTKTIDTITTGQQLQEEVDAFALDYCRRLAENRTDNAVKEFFEEGMSCLIAAQFFTVAGIAERCIPTQQGVITAAQAYVEKHALQPKETKEQLEVRKAQEIARTRCLAISTVAFFSVAITLTVTAVVMFADVFAKTSGTASVLAAVHGLPLVGLGLALGLMCLGGYLAVAWSQQPKLSCSAFFGRESSSTASSELTIS